MAYNGFGGYSVNPYMAGNQYNQPYQPNIYPQYQNQSMSQNMNVAQQNQTTFNNVNDYPIIGVRFVNESEANALTVPPNSRILLMDTNNQVFWIKWADSMGKSSMEKYKFDKFDGNEIVANVTTEEPKYLNPDELSDFVRKDDIKAFLTAKDLPEIITKDDLTQLSTKFEEQIAKLEKKIKLSQILDGKEENN